MINTTPETPAVRRRRNASNLLRHPGAGHGAVLTPIAAPLQCLGFRGVDLTGYSSGRLVITGLIGRKIYPSGAQVYMWTADCQCGAKGITVNGQHFSNGGVQSCGCLCKDRSAESKKGNSIRTKRVSCQPLRLKAQDVLDRGKDFPSFKGKKIGKLKVKGLAYGVLYWSRRTSERGKSGGFPINKHLVTHWDCVCDCGTKVVKSSSYLYKKTAQHACHKCIRQAERTQPVVAATPGGEV